MPIVRIQNEPFEISNGAELEEVIKQQARRLGIGSFLVYLGDRMISPQEIRSGQIVEGEIRIVRYFQAG
jgi:hypothetical protein